MVDLHTDFVNYNNLSDSLKQQFSEKLGVGTLK